MEIEITMDEKRNISVCSQHGEEITSFCKKCLATVCSSCVQGNHRAHAESVCNLAEHAENVRRNIKELLQQAQDSPYLRIQTATNITLEAASVKKDALLKELETRKDERLSSEAKKLERLDEIETRLKHLKKEALQKRGDGSTSHSELQKFSQKAEEMLNEIDGIIERLRLEEDNASGLNIEFFGMRPDGSVGELLRNTVNVVGLVTEGRKILYVADNRKDNCGVIVGYAVYGESLTDNCIMSFHPADNSSPVVSSSRIALSKSKKPLLMVATGKYIYLLNLDHGGDKCISDQTRIKESSSTWSSISGIDWFRDDHAALISVNTVSKLFIVDLDTMTVLQTVVTSINPSIISSRRKHDEHFVIVRDNTSVGRLVVLNQQLKEEYTLSPSTEMKGYIPWVSCWVTIGKTVAIAVIWCKPRRWKVAIHDKKGKVVKESPDNFADPIPVIIAYSHHRQTLILCSRDSIKQVSLTF